MHGCVSLLAYLLTDLLINCARKVHDRDTHSMHAYTLSLDPSVPSRQVCQILGVPFIALKSITDLIDSEHTTREEFERNLGMASEKISEKLTLLLSEIGGTDLSSWRANGASVNHSKL